MVAVADDNMISRRCRRSGSRRLGALGGLGGENRFSSPSVSAPISLTSSSGSGSYASFSPITASTSSSTYSLPPSSSSYLTSSANPTAATYTFNLGSSSSPISLASYPSTANASNILGSNYSLTQFGAPPMNATSELQTQSPGSLMSGYQNQANEAYDTSFSGMFLNTAQAVFTNGLPDVGKGLINGLVGMVNSAENVAFYGGNPSTFLIDQITGTSPSIPSIPTPFSSANPYDQAAMNIASVAGPTLLTLGTGEAYSAESSGINYGELDELGRPTGVNATITQDMIGTGTPANPEIIPPGWSGNGTVFNEARGHLIGAQLGGSGDVAENLVTLQQNPANSPIMRGFETSIRNAVENGEVVNYSATPIYNGTNLVPRGITLSGSGSGGFGLDVTILNPAG